MKTRKRHGKQCVMKTASGKRCINTSIAAGGDKCSAHLPRVQKKVPVFPTAKTSPIPATMVFGYHEKITWALEGEDRGFLTADSAIRLIRELVNSK